MAVSFLDLGLCVVTGNLAELEESSCTAVSGGDEGGMGKGVCEEHLLTGHTGAVVCLAMYEDRLLFSGSTDCTIKVLTTHSLFHDIPVGFPNIPVSQHTCFPTYLWCFPTHLFFPVYLLFSTYLLPSTDRW